MTKIINPGIETKQLVRFIITTLLSDIQCRFFGIWCSLRTRPFNDTWKEIHKGDLLNYYNFNKIPEEEWIISTRESNTTEQTVTSYGCIDLTYPDPVWWAGVASRFAAESHPYGTWSEDYLTQLNYLLKVIDKSEDEVKNLLVKDNK